MALCVKSMSIVWTSGSQSSHWHLEKNISWLFQDLLCRPMSTGPDLWGTNVWALYSNQPLSPIALPWERANGQSHPPGQLSICSVYNNHIKLVIFFTIFCTHKKKIKFFKNRWSARKIQSVQRCFLFHLSFICQQLITVIHVKAGQEAAFVSTFGVNAQWSFMTFHNLKLNSMTFQVLKWKNEISWLSRFSMTILN